MSEPSPIYVAFRGERRLARGPAAEVIRRVHAALSGGDAATVFDVGSGAVVDLDLRGTVDDAVARAFPPVEDAPRPRGRPRLGVTAREVTLLPRHWDWLAGQPGGASAALRRLVEDAARASNTVDARRRRRDAAYRFMSTMAGDRKGFEEASRALFADRRADLETRLAVWPADVAAEILRIFDGDEA